MVLIWQGKSCKDVALVGARDGERGANWGGPVMPENAAVAIRRGHPPALTNRPLTAAKRFLQYRQQLDGPAVHSRMIDPVGCCAYMVAPNLQGAQWGSGLTGRRVAAVYPDF
jgi:hypothetical protein